MCLTRELGADGQQVWDPLEFFFLGVFVLEEEALKCAWSEGGVAVCFDDGCGVHGAVVAVAGEDAFFGWKEGVICCCSAV